MSWTDERVELLRKLWGEGLSASQCARHIGGGFSRNAVIGKVTRLGLPGRKVKVRRPAHDPHNTEDRRTERRRYLPAQVKPKVSSNWRSEPLPETQEADVARVSFIDLESHHCRFIPGDPRQIKPHEPQFCGCSVAPGLPYCSTHAHRAFAPILPKPSTGGKPIYLKGRIGNVICADIQNHKAAEEFTSA